MERTYKKIKVNSSWIKDNIIKKDWQRSIYPATVNKFARDIKEGKFISSLITIAKDKNNGKYILIDGQHRLEAIKKENAEFEMDFCVYEDLLDEEMYNEYYIKNNGRVFRLVDDLKGYLALKRYDWLDAFFNKNFPIEVTLHGGINSVKIGDILNVLNNGLFSEITRKNLSRNTLPMFLETLDAEKFGLMKDFCSLYLKSFGSPHRDNWMYKNAIMFTLMRIWIKNKDNFKEDEFIKRFRPIERAVTIRQDATAGVFDTGILEQVTRKMYKIINKGYSKKLMEQFWENKK
jgi:hypothetical protein